MGELLSVRRLTAGYGAREVLKGVDLSVEAGQLVAVLGPNGAGKSTLVRACLGLIPLGGGEVKLAGRPLAACSRRELAQLAAWVPQHLEAQAGFTGLELVLMGRSPHLGLWGLPSKGDLERAKAALSELSVEGLSSRSCAEVSGGERRLLWLARALAQEPKLLVLDEPTAHLDLKHQVDVLARVKHRVKGGLGALAVLHDVNQAAMFADQVVLLKEGKVLEAGAVSEVLREEALERLFEVPMASLEAAGGQRLFAPRQA
ncbi:MAG: ABC transporter ATP-binding protein [Myxococcales bacterium]|nr:ABC transporter ATP-binding protein [Myxococcales bacterium]